MCHGRTRTSWICPRVVIFQPVRVFATFTASSVSSIPATTRRSPGVYSSAMSIRSPRSEEHTSELQSLMRISYAVFCLKKKKHQHDTPIHHYRSHLTTATQSTPTQATDS